MIIKNISDCLRLTGCRVAVVSRDAGDEQNNKSEVFPAAGAELMLQ